MGFDLIETGDMLMRIRRRHRFGNRSSLYKTGWGPLLLGVAFLLILIGVIIASKQEESRQKSIIRTSESIAIIVFVLSIIVDLIMRKD